MYHVTGLTDCIFLLIHLHGMAEAIDNVFDTGGGGNEWSTISVARMAFATSTSRSKSDLVLDYISKLIHILLE